MRKRLLQLAAVTLVLLAASFGPAKTAQACVTQCVILCSPPSHCCIVNGCAGCYVACPPPS
jgi:hypothetical protein